MGVDNLLREAAENIKLAILEEGLSPKYHQYIMRTHRTEWPTLWKAIDRLLIVLEIQEGNYEPTRKSDSESQ